MTQQEILEYNKMCAEFLEYEFDELSETYETPHLKLVEPQAFGDEQFSCKLKIYELDFHSDWNWIMAVVEKIKYIEDNQEKFFGEEYYLIHFEIDLLNGVDLFIDKKRLFSQSAFGEGQLKEAVVQAINQFLIWYEQNKAK